MESYIIDKKRLSVPLCTERPKKEKDYNEVFEMINDKLKEIECDDLIELLKKVDKTPDEIKDETDFLRIQIRKKILRQGTLAKKLSRESGKRAKEAKEIKARFVAKKTEDVKALIYNVTLFALKEINNKF